MRTFYIVALLVVSNVFMTFAWYGHLQFEKWGFTQKWGMVGLILISWFIALFEYVFQVPANKLGYLGQGGPFDIFELKTLQEVILLSIFLVINTLIFNEKLQWNHLLSFALIILAVYVAYKKWYKLAKPVVSLPNLSSTLCIYLKKCF